ncbi:MAG TPA: hypothetical protein VEU78_03135 [Steroidobacteraceae bacterium]|nr:hypothetical protein [Steroidobacteraceae bacterium]
MATRSGAPGSIAHGPADEAERRRRVRRTAILFAVIAAAFYFGFIALILVRGTR